MPPQDLRTFDVSSGTIFRIVLILIGFWFLYVIIDLLLMLFAAIVVASAIMPVANRLERYRVPRGLSVVIVYAIVALIFTGVITLIIPPLTDQISALVRAMPGILEQIDVPYLSDRLGDISIAPLQQVLENLLLRTRTFFSSAFLVAFVFIIAFYLTIERDALKKPFRILLPAQHVPYAETVIDRAQRKIGRWVLAQLFLALVIGVTVGSGLWLLGVPYALLLGLLSGVFEVVPVLGPVLAAIPGVVVGLSQSLIMGLIVLVFYIVVQQAENHFLIPTVMRRATGLNPLITILAVLLGARLAGVVGVILAVPAAAVLQTFVSDLLTSSGETTTTR